MRPSSSNIYEQVNSASYKHTPQPSKTYQTNIAMMETSGASVTISCGEVYQSVDSRQKSYDILASKKALSTGFEFRQHTWSETYSSRLHVWLTMPNQVPLLYGSFIGGNVQDPSFRGTVLSGFQFSESV